MAWYRVWYEMKVPVVRYNYLIEVNEDDAEAAAAKARSIAHYQFWDGYRPEVDIELEEQNGVFYSYKVEGETDGTFQGMAPTDPEFERTIFGKYFVVPAEDSADTIDKPTESE